MSTSQIQQPSYLESNSQQMSLRRCRVCRSISSKRWMEDHASDVYVREARRRGYVARSAFKLCAIDDQLGLFRPTATAVVDLGASPGGWCQVIERRCSPRCTLVAVDLLPLRVPLGNGTFIRGDFTMPELAGKVQSVLEDKECAGLVDVVTSDMCPNRSGGSEDQHRIAELDQHALHFALQQLKTGGHFVCKILGNTLPFDLLMKTGQKHFQEVRVIRPPASRVESSESFFVCRGKLARPREASQSKHRYGMDDWPGFLRGKRR